MAFVRESEPIFEKAFLDLIESKHLYQSVRVGVNGLKLAIKDRARKALSAQSYIMPSLGGGSPSFGKAKSWKQILAEYEQEAFDCLQQAPCIIGSQVGKHADPNCSIVCPLPVAKLYCNDCGGLWPHKRLADHSFLIPISRVGNEIHQLFLLHFQCSNCTHGRSSILVKRAGPKLTLCGRSPIEEIDCPKFIASSIRKFYRGAMIAFNSGAILPAIAMLRVMIEQHMRQTIGAEDKRMSGDELTAAYAKKLNPDFMRQHQSLKPVYDALSNAIHLAKDDDPEIFIMGLKQALTHLEAKKDFERLFGGKQPQA